MSPTALALIAVGLVMIAVGAIRARGPWARYQALKAQEANIARYESWRGGLRDTGPTGASVAMAMLFQQVRINGFMAGLGFVAVVAGIMLG